MNAFCLFLFSLIGLICIGIGRKMPIRAFLGSPSHFVSHDASLSKKLVNKLLRMRAVSNKHDDYCIWYYTGFVRDPANGRKLVGIEGVEKVRPLYNRNLTSILKIKSSINNITEAINEEAQLSQNSKRKSSSVPISYLSHKLFMYVDVHNRTSPITTFRKTRMAPARKVDPLKELMEWIQLDVEPTDPTSAFGKDLDKNSVVDQNDHSQDDQKCRIRSTIMWPGGRTIVGQLALQPLNDESNGNTQQESLGLIVSHSVRGRIKKPVNRWIALGPNGELNMGKSNEIYRISEYLQKKNIVTSLLSSLSLMKQKQSGSLSKSPVRMYYKRYGASPEWLAPQKPCEIEINGYRFSDLSYLSPEVRKLFESYRPDYFITGAPVESNMIDIKRDPMDKFKPWYIKVATFLSR